MKMKTLYMLKDETSHNLSSFAKSLLKQTLTTTKTIPNPGNDKKVSASPKDNAKSSDGNKKKASKKSAPKRTTIIPGPIDKEIEKDPILDEASEQQEEVAQKPNKAEQPMQENEKLVFSDNFRVRSKSLKCSELISDIQLPKFAFIPSLKKQNGSQGPKSFVLIEVMGGIDKKRKINAYTDLLKASRDGLKDFYIDLLNEENEVLMTITLEEPRVHAIDFGTFAMEREEVRTIKVEIDYEFLVIDGEQI